MSHPINCCNTSPCDQQFKALQGNLTDTRLEVLEQDRSGKKISARCWC